MLAIAPQGETPALRCEQTGNSLAFVDVPDGIELSGSIIGDSVTLNQHQVLSDEETTSVYDATVTLSGIQTKGKTASGTIVIEGTYTGFGYLTYQSGVDQFGNPIIVTDNCTWNGVVTGYIVPSETLPVEDSLPYDLGVKRIDMAVASKEADDAMDAEFVTLVDDLEFVEDKNERVQIGNESKENVLVIRNDARVGVEEILEQGRIRWRDRTTRGRPDILDRDAWKGFVQSGAATLRQIHNSWVEINRDIDYLTKDGPEEKYTYPSDFTSVYLGDSRRTEVIKIDCEVNTAAGIKLTENGAWAFYFLAEESECCDELRWVQYLTIDWSFVQRKPDGTFGPAEPTLTNDEKAAMNVAFVAGMRAFPAAGRSGSAVPQDFATGEPYLDTKPSERDPGDDPSYPNTKDKKYKIYWKDAETREEERQRIPCHLLGDEPGFPRQGMKILFDAMFKLAPARFRNQGPLNLGIIVTENFTSVLECIENGEREIIGYWTWQMNFVYAGNRDFSTSGVGANAVDYYYPSTSGTVPPVPIDRATEFSVEWRSGTPPDYNNLVDEDGNVK
ncbi:MAG: hypothetical protein NUW37_09575 [Planctomycetes bacterium]|nr:hypothetical protein [Planctomycetota bacterium]